MRPALMGGWSGVYVRSSYSVNKNDYFSPVSGACEQCARQGLEIRRRGGGKTQRRAADRVGKPKSFSVQGLTRKIQRLAARGLWQELGGGRAALEIDRIADQRMPRMRHVHADLVRPPGLQPAFHEGGGQARIT